jgi:hypothetical protein
MVQILIHLLLNLAVVAALVAVLLAVILLRNPDLHIWPSVTRCRVCEQRVYVWQRRDFRPYLVRLDDPDGLLADYPGRISASGIVHHRCKGTPTVTLPVRRRSTG